MKYKYTVDSTSDFKKDYKKIIKQGKKLEKIKTVIDKLACGEKIDSIFLTNVPMQIALGVIVNIVSQMGDLSASAIKRYAEIKDFSHLMPGHGGMLDRFDSVLFIAPIIYYAFFIINHI